MNRILLFIICCVISVQGYSQIINTIAGDGVAGYSGDGGIATDAQLNACWDVVADAQGNVYISDYNNHRIRKVNQSGFISTFAGTGTAGFSGNGGPALSADIRTPAGSCIDHEGNLIFAELANHCVRKINLSTGVISLVAGGNGSGLTGDGGLAVNAKLNYPYNVHCDAAGNIYIADTYNHRVRKVDATTGIISTVINAGTEVLSVHVTADNLLYYGLMNYRIWVYNLSSGVNQPYAGTGSTGFNGDGLTALNTNIFFPYDISCDAEGNIVFSDFQHWRVRRIDKATTRVSTIVGTGTAGYSGDGGAPEDAQIQYISGIFVDACNNVYMADYAYHVVRKSAFQYTAASTPDITANHVCAGGSSVVQISGTLNNATAWKLYSFGCGSVAEGSTDGNSITFTPSAGGVYYVRGEGPCVSIGTCATVNITVAADPWFVANPAGTTQCAGYVHSLTALASGGLSALQYQWQVSENASDWADIEAAQSNTYTSEALWQPVYYRCKASTVGEGCDDGFSEVAFVNIIANPANNTCANAIEIGVIPYNSGVLNNNCADNYLPASATCSEAVHNVWFRVQGNGNKFSVTTNHPITEIDAVINVFAGTCDEAGFVACSYTGEVEWCSSPETEYYIVVGSAASSPATGNYVLSLIETVLALPVFSANTTTVCQGAEITFTASPGNNGDVVAWYMGDCSGAAAATGNSFTETYSESQTVYAQTRSSECAEAASACVSVQVNVQPQLGFVQQPAGGEICSGGTWSMSTEAAGGTPAVNYSWQVSADNVLFENIPFSNFANYTTPALSQTRYYRCVAGATGAGCNDAISTTATVLVVPDPHFVLQPVGAGVCHGDYYSMSVELAGGTPQNALQWQISPEQGVWQNIDGATETQYVYGPVTGDVQFRVVATASGNGCNQAISNIASVFVYDAISPVPDMVSLPDVTGQCMAEITQIPTANDNCDGPITAITEDDLLYEEQGMYLITWIFEDAAGNQTLQTQMVFVEDSEAPVPDMETLPVINGECEAEITTYPFATDNCSGSIQAITQDPLSYSIPGTYFVMWTYTDLAGNTHLQSQTVIVSDNEDPTLICPANTSADAASNHFYTVQGSEFDAFDISDNCGVASVFNSFNQQASLAGELLPEGVNSIIWTVLDHAGNSQWCVSNITVLEFVGLSEDVFSEVLVYPNPGKGVFYLQTDVRGQAVATVSNMLGETVFSSDIMPGSHVHAIDLSHLAAGCYFVRLLTDASEYRLRLIIE